MFDEEKRDSCWPDAPGDLMLLVIGGSGGTPLGFGRMIPLLP
jgi:hypothetical protein